MVQVQLLKKLCTLMGPTIKLKNPSIIYGISICVNTFIGLLKQKQIEKIGRTLV
jgi:hypothetical protein